MKKIAIIGASYLQEPLVEKANSLGYQTHCFAWNNAEAVCKEKAHYFYPISVLEKEAILQKCLDINIDGITTIATDISIPTISFVADKMGLTSNTINSSLLATNKSKMRKAFDSHNVKSPKSITISKLEELDNINLTYPLIVKPTDRSGSRGVVKVNSEIEINQAIVRALTESFEKKIVVEEFIEGHEISVESISWQGKHYIVAITDKKTTESPFFVEIQHHQPSELPSHITDIIRFETMKALDSLEIQFGASHSEFKITDRGEIFVIEVGARMGGDFIGSHLVPLSTGYDYITGVIEVAMNQFIEPVVTQQNYSGVYFLGKETEYLLPYFKKSNSFDVYKKITKKSINNIQNSNDRSGFLIYQSDSKIELLPQL